MKIDDDVLDDYGDVIDVFGKDQYVGFDDERDFIEKAIGVFDNAKGTGSNQKIESVSKKMDLSPIVEYFSIGGWKKEPAEIADFLFLVYHIENGSIVDRYTMLSQAKYSDDNSNPEFDIKMHQYDLLHNLPVFKLDRPSHWYKHWISPERKSFSTYLFVGECWNPFFQLTETMVDKIDYDYYDTSDKKFKQNKQPETLDRMDVFLKRFLQGKLGEHISTDGDIYKFYDIMFSQSSAWPWSTSPNTITDGGGIETPPPEGEEAEGEDNGMGVVQFLISGSDTPQFDDMQLSDDLLIY